MWQKRPYSGIDYLPLSPRLTSVNTLCVFNSARKTNSGSEPTCGGQFRPAKRPGSIWREMSSELRSVNDAAMVEREVGSQGRYLHQHAAPAPGQNDLRARARPPGAASAEPDSPAPEAEPVDDCERLGTLFGELNKCLRSVGFVQLYFGEKIVEPVVVVLFWLLLWFLGIQALGLVGTLCIVIIYIQK
ncbi:uncharacterized protein FAM241A isoform X2 [Brachyhypopomus gauderio]|uniref:uncharacterized protein FAM241A isoform X2 n=1 Tax=Brachyhypopomus gauderio TaxID=698409 RepID=UPI0040411AD3